MSTVHRLSAADDLLVHQLPRPFAEVGDDSPNWFDRFYFSLHPPGPGPTLVIGAGVYPNTDVADGYACLVAGEHQRNVRFSRPTGSNRALTEIGPLRWEVVEPLRRWRLRVDAPMEGFAADVVYTARTQPFAVEPIAVEHADGPRTDFAHFFQPGSYEGHLEIDGEKVAVEGWLGLRDRSWGVRRTREKLGMHLWGGAHFYDYSLAVNFNVDRDGNQTHLDGALLPVGGGDPVLVTGFRHALSFDEGGEFVDGTYEATLATGRSITLSCRSLTRGLYMAGAGYGGWHGQARGDHVEHERWELDAVEPRTLSLALVDKLCVFDDGEREGVGILELALSRSSSFQYRPTIELQS